MMARLYDGTVLRGLPRGMGSRPSSQVIGDIPLGGSGTEAGVNNPEGRATREGRGASAFGQEDGDDGEDPAVVDKKFKKLRKRLFHLVAAGDRLIFQATQELLPHQDADFSNLVKSNKVLNDFCERFLFLKALLSDRDDFVIPV